eukprot:TRINITY_DN1990_c0_g1_i1.p1 TRINITY_DN1990_c0_g1~~TRINITY_DN1990_c0_g1_i1.p1  ORF type:complete len:666 (+),score=177.78 TRINITY_DN1990_c0_g1_i1:69-2000(+)
MASKLEYLKKYLAAPGDNSKPAPAAVRPATLPASHGGKKKKKRVDHVPFGGTALKIRDLSEALPGARQERARSKPEEFLASDLSGARWDEKPEFVNADEVEEAQKAATADVEKSGVAWTIKQHQKSKAKGSSAGFVKREVPAAARSTRAIKEEEVKQEQVDSDADLSPPRARPGANPPARQGKARTGSEEEKDLSPPRASSKASKLNVQSRARHDSDSDLSPPRAEKATQQQPGDKAESDLSPPRAAPKATKQAVQPRARHDSDSDLSPPRADKAAQQQQSSKAENDLSPPRAAPKTTKQIVQPRARHDSDSDLSPPRANKPVQQRPGGREEKDLSPPRAAPKATKQAAQPRARHDSDSDISPPRAQKAAQPPARHDSDSDISPPRAQKAAAGGQTRQRHDSDSDISPPREAAARKTKRKAAEDDEPEKMSSGLRAGLVRGSQLKEEAAQVRAERKAAVEAAPDDQTGKGAQTVYRNREGKRIEREEWVDQQQKKKKKKSDYPEQELEWGGGLKQRDSLEAEKEELVRIAAQPFARFEPDQRYMEELKAKQDWNDPMRKNQEEEEQKAPTLTTEGQSVAAAAKKRPQCPHQPWPNRYDIKPGYRWDGKVRGNGHEQRWLANKNHQEFLRNDRWRKEQAADDHA